MSVFKLDASLHYFRENKGNCAKYIMVSKQGKVFYLENQQFLIMFPSNKEKEGTLMSIYTRAAEDK